jgi:hypothetical protein
VGGKSGGQQFVPDSPNSPKTRVSARTKEIIVRTLSIIGVLLIVFGILALSIQSITYFTTERAVDIGPLQIDVQRPHTIVFHPFAGAVAVGAGLLLVVVGAKRTTH